MNKSIDEMTDDELLNALQPHRELIRLYQVVGDGDNSLMDEQTFKARYQTEPHYAAHLRPELQNEPALPGYAGPMWGGWRDEDGASVWPRDDGNPFAPCESYGSQKPIVAVVTRYETWEAYEALSR